MLKQSFPLGVQEIIPYLESDLITKNLFISMKKHFLVLLAYMSFFAVKAQDKIITIQNDTIECRIISVNSDRISYEQKESPNQFVGKSIATSEVLQYHRSVQTEKVFDIGLQKKFWIQPENRWLFSLQSGLSHSFNDYEDFRNLLSVNDNPDSKVNDYIRKLKNGYFMNPGFHYRLTNFLGVGADYSFFHSETSGEFIIKITDYSGHNLPIYQTYTQNEKLYIHFTGASILLSQHPGKKKKIKISETLSPGIIFFRDESRSKEYQDFWGSSDYYDGQTPPQYYNYANAASTSKSFGFKGGISFEYFITSRLSAGFTGNIVLAKLHKITINGSRYNTENQKLEKQLDISRIDYGISIRYNL